MDINAFGQSVQSLGFPAAVAAFLLWQGKVFLDKMIVAQEKQAEAMEKQAEALNQLTTVIQLLQQSCTMKGAEKE